MGRGRHHSITAGCPAPGRTDAPDPALDLQFFYLFFNRPVGHASMLCNFPDGDRRVLAHEFDDFWGTFLRTSHLPPVHRGGKEAAGFVPGVHPPHSSHTLTIMCVDKKILESPPSKNERDQRVFIFSIEPGPVLAICHSFLSIFIMRP